MADPTPTTMSVDLAIGHWSVESRLPIFSVGGLLADREGAFGWTTPNEEHFVPHRAETQARRPSVWPQVLRDVAAVVGGFVDARQRAPGRVRRHLVRDPGARLQDGLRRIPGLRLLQLKPSVTADRVGLATFTLAGLPDALVAAILSAEHAIGVRQDCFCAHPLIVRLLGISDAQLAHLGAELGAGRRPPLPGAVRVSLGIGTTADDIDLLIAALGGLSGSGPRWRYRHVPAHDEYQPITAAPVAA